MKKKKVMKLESVRKWWREWEWRIDFARYNWLKEKKRENNSAFSIDPNLNIQARYFLS